MKRLTSILVMTIILLTLNALSFADNYYVDAVKGSDTNSGTSADTAWKTITYSMSTVNRSDTNQASIFISHGTYNLALGEKFPIAVKDFVSLVGEDSKNTIIDATGSETSVFSYLDLTKVSIEKLTITGGEGTPKAGMSADNYFGGGLYISNTDIDIIDCFIKGNKATYGAGIYFVKSNVLIKNCEISNNTNNSKVDNCCGGGIACNNSSGLIENCQIVQNTAISSGGGIYGIIKFPDIVDCQIIDNHVVSSKGIGSAGGIYLDECSPLIKNCTINKNEGNFGGGLSLNNAASPTLINTQICENSGIYIGGIEIETNSNPVFTNCLIAGNHGTDDAVIYLYEYSSPQFNLCTVVGNRGKDGNLFYCEDGTPAITSSILWDNGSIPINDTISVKYSDIQFGHTGEGNIDNDPLFVTGPWGNYYLSQKVAKQNTDSPCINAGSEVPVADFNQSDYITRTDGVVDTGRVDMGYHYMPHVRFGLALDPVKANYTSGDNITLSFDVATAPVVTKVNIYLLMVDPDGNIYSAMAWNKGLQPLVQGLSVPKDLDITGAAIANFVLPSTKPAISKAGTYTFYMAALKPGSADFVSNIATSGFTMQ